MAAFKLALFFALLTFAAREITANYRVCTERESETNCLALERDDSKVSCVRVTNNIECALLLASGDADFASFSEEELLLIAQQQSNLNDVIATLKHSEKLNDSYAFETVVIVKSNHQGGLDGLRGGGFCHPGYDRHEIRWSPRVLKYFEKKVAINSNQCTGTNRSPAAFDAEALNGFFNGACRPGKWSYDDEEDAALKSRYPNLCSLCNPNGSISCNYNYTNQVVNVDGGSNPHTNALQCIRLGYGNVTYAAWQHTKNFFSAISDISSFGLLCENGTVIPLEHTHFAQTSAPCSWIRQPWSAIATTKAKSANLFAELKTWLPEGSVENRNNWQRTLATILVPDPFSRITYPSNVTSVESYVTSARPLTTNEADSTCNQMHRWCTTSEDEQLKCDWVRAASNSLGIEPTFTCEQVTGGEIGCLNHIQSSRAEFFMSDSNYGYLARQHYKLSAALYTQTRRDVSSRVVAVVKNNNGGNITRFENLRNKTACFPEYGGIAWVSFTNAARERSVISATECNYPLAVSEFFYSACAPGADQTDHSLNNPVESSNLCSACRVNTNFPLVSATQSTCAANYTNRFFATNGTLACLAAEHTDVAFIEIQNLTDDIIRAAGLNDSNVRALCRNNTLASNTGLRVDDDCLLSFTVDGEILTRRDYDGLTTLRSLLWQLEDTFGYNTGRQLMGFKMYSTFNNKANLLFKDSTTSLANATSQNEQIRNYVELFKHLDECSSAYHHIPSFLTITFVSIMTLLFKY